MQLKINKLLLEHAIERVAKAIDSNPFIPSMKGVLISAQDNKITFIGSNGEISIKHEVETSLDAEITVPGIFLVELSLFRNIIKKLDGDVVLDSDDKILKISTENDEYCLNLYPTNEYPDIDFEVYGDTLKIKWNDFKEMIRDVIFAASNNETTLILCCVNIMAHNNKLKLVTTDRHRYAEVINDTESPAEFNISILSKNLRDLMNFEYSSDVILHISEHKILFQIDNTIIQSKVIDQPYQDVSKIVPKEFETELKISKKELNNLLNKASVIITENYNKIRFHILDDTLTISSTRDEIGNAKVKTQKFEYNGQELKLALNGKYLKEAIAVYDDNLVISFTKNNLRIVITSPSKPNVLQLITPQKGF
ncbi:DNA polymerase III subunit beta [Metamycoplasma spumans]|uniref:DNA polymerase III subunit beta n=1 Tax=Metamycoplasma spumans TaxID=92406 RepID=UPI00048113AD